MDLNGQFVGWRHDHDLGRSLRRINARKEGQQISQRFTGARLRSQIRVLPGSERRNCGDLNGAGLGYLLLHERNYQFGRQRQIGRLHEIELAAVASNTYLSRGMVAGRAVILAALLVTSIGEGNAGTPTLACGRPTSKSSVRCLDSRAALVVTASPLPNPYFNSLVIASAALLATTQFADPGTTSSNQRTPKSSMHSGKSGSMIT